MTPKELAQACELAFNSVEQLTKEAKEREKGIKTMSEKKHTPGPWKVDNSGVRVVKQASNGSGDLICDTASTVFVEAEQGFHAVGNRANARLIAAAPSLLEAAQRVVDSWESGDLAEAVRELDAAIQEAQPEGRL